jgi:glycosyltransferase involved in cell wall biosynthesis
VLFVGRTRYRLPLADGLARKWDALQERLDVRVLAAAAPGSPRRDERFRLVPAFPVAALDGLAFYLSLPFAIARQLREFRPDVVIAESPYEGAAALLGRRLGRSRARVVVEAHGDWRASTRLYGSPARRLAAPAGDALASLSLRRADSVRAISPYTARLLRERGLEPAAVFPAYSDLTVFAGPLVAMPARPRALFVGALEGPKNIDGLVAAWRSAAARVPTAHLLVVGDGIQRSLVQKLVDELPEQTEWRPRLEPREVAEALDGSWLLTLPSRTEGLGRVVIEAFMRGRPVVGARVGGIADMVVEGDSGMLVEPADTEALSDTLVALLSERSAVERLAKGAAAAAARWRSTPAEYAQNVVDLVEAALR